MEIFKRLKELDLPLGKYIIIGSGILDVLGIREANDLDILVKSDLYQALKAKPEFKAKIKDGEQILITDDVEIIQHLERNGYSITIEKAIKTAILINGFPFLNLEETIKFKTAFGREKDFRDLMLIKEYQENIL